MICFLYGAGPTYIDVTRQVFESCISGDLVHIPAGDTGSAFFPDPLPGIAKEILVIRKEGDLLSGQSFGPNEEVRVLLHQDDKPISPDSEHGPSSMPRRNIVSPPVGMGVADSIAFFHSQLRFSGGNLNDEWIEQHNTVEFLDPNASVLELGGGLGRNAMLISCVLNDETRFVTLECNVESAETLSLNRSVNGFRFHIEPAALSYRQLMYNASLALTVPGSDLLDGYEWVNTVTFEEIQSKYATEFDTLVADCEGALYYILQDNEFLLEKIGMIILESDYRLPGQKQWVEDVFARYGLKKVKSWRLHPPSVDLPPECIESFWEVWQR